MNILPEHKLLISDVRQNGSGPACVAWVKSRLADPVGTRSALDARRGGQTMSGQGDGVNRRQGVKTLPELKPLNEALPVHLRGGRARFGQQAA